MDCPNCKKILLTLVHVIIECPIGHKLNKTGIREKEVKILGVETKTIFCKCGYFEVAR